MESTWLIHHGIKGQKWGVRRYQNSDGTLTDVGKKRISKKYKSYMKKGDKNLRKEYNKIQLNSYNEAVDKTNATVHTKNVSKLKKEFEKKYDQILSRNLNDFRSNNKYYKKASELVKKYGMLHWDALAKENAKGIDAVKKRGM